MKSSRCQGTYLTVISKQQDSSIKFYYHHNLRINIIEDDDDQDVDVVDDETVILESLSVIRTLSLYFGH